MLDQLADPWLAVRDNAFPPPTLDRALSRDRVVIMSVLVMPGSIQRCGRRTTTAVGPDSPLAEPNGPIGPESGRTMIGNDDVEPGHP